MLILTDEMQVLLPDGRAMLASELVKDYQRLQVMERESTKVKVGQWFRCDRIVINKNKEEIRRKCYEEGPEGEHLYGRFECSNKFIDESIYCDSTVIETYIFEADRCNGKTDDELQAMCKVIGDGMCFSAICDLELQMRICNGESVHYLLHGIDELKYARLISAKHGGFTGLFGGDGRPNMPPSMINFKYFSDNKLRSTVSAYAFRALY